tara:strand:+ start:21194 stop:21424 length:231 start_codon:yes stop_codon:yes gene_type:complete
MFIKKLKCFIFGHQTHEHIHQTSKFYSHRIICSRCGGDWDVNDDVRAVRDWNNKCAEMYSTHKYKDKAKHLKWGEK